MSISFSCTGCGRTLKVADELAGRKAKCPQCQTVLYIPEGPAVAVTPAPTPASRTAPVPRRQEEYDDRADAGEEPEDAPRRRKKAKKSVLGPVLLAVGAVLLLVVLGGGSFAAWWFLSGGAASEDLLFMPDGVQMVGQVHVDQITNSDALKQVYAAFPQLKAQVDQAASQSAGVDQNNLDRIYFGASKVDSAAKSPPAAIAVMHFKNSIKVEDFENGMKKNASSGPITMNYTFTDTKIGKYTMTEVKMAMSFNPPGGGIKGMPPPPPPTPTPMFAFAMPDDKRLVMGSADALKAVLTRNKKPDVNDKLQAAIKQTDWNATIAYAANVKDGFAIPPGQTQSIPLPIDKVDGLSVTIKIASDVDVNVTALCKDAGAAGELSGGISTLVKAGASSPQMAKAPPELKDLTNLTPQVSGSNVTIQKTIKVAPLLNLAKGNGQANPFGLFNPFGMGK